MEDRYYFKTGDLTIALICDGHGGYQTAAATVANLTTLFRCSLRGSLSNVQCARAIKMCIMAWGIKVAHFDSGSTLTGIIIKGETIFVFNVGDSRTSFKLRPFEYMYKMLPRFGENGEALPHILVDYFSPDFFSTFDHNDKSPVEMTRLTSAGGRIVNGRLNGILSLTRAFGDSSVGAGLSFVPDIFWCDRDKIDGPILLYSDGVYEAIQETAPKEIYDIAMRNPRDINELVNYAQKQGSSDNITAMVIMI